MDKSCHPSADSTNTSITTSSAASNSNSNSNSNSRDHYLRHLNKLSQKISKPVIKKPSLESLPNQNLSVSNEVQGHQNLQHQPPVYNINKNDFRDVVQKLTGSPAHDRISTPPPIHQPKPPSSRLHRIRPPPLPQITNRPAPLLNPRPQFPNAVSLFPRPPAPLSPLPPFPAVHAPAESPISAYMRDLHNLVHPNINHFSGFPPSAALPQPPPQPLPLPQQPVVPSQAPSSPVPFGCLNSQLASYPLLSPGLLFSPTSAQLGFPQLPLSPTVPVPSPRWRAI